MGIWASQTSLNSETQATLAMPLNRTFKPGDIAIETGVYRVAQFNIACPMKWLFSEATDFPSVQSAVKR